ncbi:T-cell surface antigen CD2 isoform X1 [Sarcophilus harrisii]|uniref:T-cell surface antigen CD2 isoform X1 n=1 Tax=Sarcophilus harrisii TaxID=9305 RepID=UPI000C7D52B7|nr:T-cell surface antigen CD2 isoform X1 [Sarcophilus harrisii]
MNFQSHFVISHLLLLFFYPRDAMVEDDMVWGMLTKSISLDIPNFLNYQNVDDIRWFKGQTLIAKIKLNGEENKPLGENTDYEIFKNGTLKIKKLEKDSGQEYKVSVYDKDGKNLLDKILILHVIEAVSKPEITWNCTEKIVTCEVRNESDAELTLFDNETQPLKKGTLKTEKMRLKYTWKYLPLKEFKCVVKNRVSEDWAVSQNPCTGVQLTVEKTLNIYHILGICGGGIILSIFVVLLIFYFLRRKKQNDQNVEMNISRVKVEGRGQKLPQSPGHHLQPHGGRHPQQPGGHRPQAPGYHPQGPGHRLQVPGHSPAVPGHRPQPQQKRSPKVKQQTGPPLPRPRNQQKPSHQEKEK